MTDRFRLYPYVPSYLAELADMWVDAWSRAMPEINFEARRGWFVDHLVSLNEGGVEVLCALDSANGTIAGVISIDREQGYIDQLAVLPAYWGEGVSKRLLEAAKKRAPGRLTLNVNQDNARAVGFYVREGFSRIGAGANPNSSLKTWRYEWRA